MRLRWRRASFVQTRTARLALVATILAATGGLTAVVVSGSGRNTADAATSLDQYVRIEHVAPNVKAAPPGRDASRGRFVVDCGTNRNGKFSPDNPVAQPGIKNGAEHLHDFVGNLAITADSSDAELDASGTTCRNGDKSSYFWPVVRIDRNVRPSAADVRAALAKTSGEVICPSLRRRLPGVPGAVRAAVDRELAGLDRQQAAAGQRIRGARGVNVQLNTAVLDNLRKDRAAAVERIGDLIGGAGGHRPRGLMSLVECDISYDSVHDGLHPGRPAPAPSTSPAAGTPSQSASPLPEPQGPDRELPGNTGGIVEPTSVLIEYRGNAAGPVVPMPKFLRALTGDAKPTSRGPANARAVWTCSGFADRMSDRYVICPSRSKVQRVHDFPGCWDGENTDSANHRAHVAFADKNTGACPAGFVAIPQLRITITYDIPRGSQFRGQYALDSFPEENHNPFSDHNDFVNVNSAQTMQKIATCINKGKDCT
jgi:hypothetical protein